LHIPKCEEGPSALNLRDDPPLEPMYAEAGLNSAGRVLNITETCNLKSLSSVF